MQTMTYTAEGLGSEIKISEYLKRLGYSRALITKVKFGGVFLNGKNVHMRAMVMNGDKVEVYFPDEQSENIPPIDIPLDIIYEDEHILAVNKPQNMPTHPSKGNSLPTLANAVVAYLGEPFVFRAVNRLDRDTSGIVIVAKNPFAAAKLAQSMKNGKFDKKYLARVEGILKEKEGRIDAPIERECEGSIKRVVRPDGKRAITDYRVVQEHSNTSSVCEIHLLTGRTHQIRVHMAYIGHPLCNDFLYGKSPLGERYQLHCHSITLPHPVSEGLITIECKADF